MPKDVKYATYVWLFSVVTSPILLLFFLIAKEGNSGIGDMVGFIGLAFAVGFALSIPCWLIFMAFVRLIHYTSLSILNQKVLIQIGALVIGSVPFIILFGDEYSEIFLFIIPYLATLSVGIWLFRLETRASADPIDITDHLIDS